MRIFRITKTSYWLAVLAFNATLFAVAGLGIWFIRWLSTICNVNHSFGNILFSVAVLFAVSTAMPIYNLVIRALVQKS